jgi:hypothetical protein
LPAQRRQPSLTEEYSMNISALSSSSSPYLQAAQRQPEATEIATAGADHDGDKDDATSVKPTARINLNGQTVGQTISTSA